MVGFLIQFSSPIPKDETTMQPFFQDYLHRLTDLHQDIINAIQGLPVEALDWTPIHQPDTEMNSINVLVTHICGSERYWIGEIACGDDSNRVRAAEFKVSGLNSAELSAKITAATQYAELALQKLGFDDLPLVKSHTQDGEPVTVGWALLHALEHAAIHLGHIQVTRQILPHPPQASLLR
jgi:uncharacterized damage-inducible protein DinB